MSSSRNASSRAKHSESNENELRNPSDTISFPTPRSPLNSIQDPSQISGNDSQIDLSSVKGAGLTPKSVQLVAARSGSRVSGGNGNVRERGCSLRVSKWAQDGKCFDAVEAPYFELNEDPEFWRDHNVQVLIRIRPISSMESATQGHKRCLIQESSQTLTWTGSPETRFTFDHVACETITQEKLFKAVGLSMVDNCMSGYNSCMFAYGQTGSGKTYTMMGEIQEIDSHVSVDRGMTPRIFEYLFTRIREEEDCQIDELRKYNCKCSFLEIYNEQITDLLEPSSTNLQLREDIKKGVYVENLKECEVSSVKDVMELILQGAANRKMASTHMNSESSRSHSVFTCVIESHREKDSVTHMRFGRLNLVDLAGSERQKTSGAEGERLKEAANINRSLSTLGLVIMTLVDITNGKNRHVPYRDSRLTFLLQDSLGGNSKTTILANVSPSICSASETLSTLKFAQRAKLIQNNAKVNEDASGDVMALQRQIHKLKDQLTFLIGHQNIPRTLCYPCPGLEQTYSDVHDDFNFLGGNPGASNDPSLINKEIKQLEASLIGALRREEMSDATVRKLEAEIKHMSRLVHQREDDAQRARALLRLREEKLRRLELLADDLVTSDGYLMEENFALSQEIQLLRETVDRNPELTHFAWENMRLLEQLRMYQNFYQQGERDKLVAEVSYLRNQLLKVIEGKLSPENKGAIQDDNEKMKELDECRRQLDACLGDAAKLTREVAELRLQLEHYSDSGQSYAIAVEPTMLKGHSGDRTAPSGCAHSVPHINTCRQIGDPILLLSQVQNELKDAKLIIKEMESKQASLLAELNDLKQENKRYLELSRSYADHRENYGQISEGSNKATKVGHLDAEKMSECGDTTQLSFNGTLKRMLNELKQAKTLYSQLLKDQLSCHHKVEHVQQKVESETAEVLRYLQEELDSMKQEFDFKNANRLSLTEHSMFSRTRNEELNSRLSFLIQENVKLSNLVSLREAEISALSYEWEKAIIDLTTFLIDGCRSLDDASDYMENVLESFPLKSTCINEHVERAIKVFIEKETLILDLQRGLEDAQKKGQEMKSKLNSLRGATLAITEVQQIENDENAKELAHLRKLIKEKSCIIQELEGILNCKEDDLIEAVKVANSAIEVIKKLDNMHPADSLNIVEIKLMIQKLVNENPQVRIIQQKRNYYPAKSKIRSFSVDSQINEVDAPQMHQKRESLQESEEINIGCSQTTKIPRSELYDAMQDIAARTNHANNLLIRCEEVQETMEEAELVLKALLKAIEGANHEKDFWKQVSMGLLTDKTALLKELRRLEVSDSSKEKQYENLQVQIHASLKEILGLASLLGESFQQIRRNTWEELNSVCSGIFSVQQELLKLIGNSRLCLEDMASEVIEKGFELSVLYQCHRGALLEQIMHSNKYSNSFQYEHDNSCAVFSSEDILDKIMVSEENCLREQNFQLERKNLELTHDMELLRGMTSELALCSDKLLEELTSQDEVSLISGSASKELPKNSAMITFDASFSSLIKVLGITYDGSHWNNMDDLDSEYGIHVDMVKDVVNDIDALLKIIQCLKSQFPPLISSTSARNYPIKLALHNNKDSNSKSVHAQNKQMMMDSSYPNAKTNEGNETLQALKKLMDNVHCLLPLILPGLHPEAKNRSVNSLFGSSWEAICCMEVKVCKLLEKCSRYGINQVDLESKNLSLEKELGRKDKLIKGLLFDLRLLQESSSSVKGMKDEVEEIAAENNELRCELLIRTAQIDKVITERAMIEAHLTRSEAELFSSKSELEQAQQALVILSDENNKLKVLLEDAYSDKSQVEELLEDKTKVIEGLQLEILSFSSSIEGHNNSSDEEMINELRSISSERDVLRTEIAYLNDRLEMASSLADENEAIAVEARQVAEASKIYAAEKEEEVKVLERSVEELEDTINMLEKKVYDMKEDVQRHQSIRNGLELEVQSLAQRMLTVENAAENLIAEYSNVGGEKSQIPRSRRLDDRIIELCEARQRIEDLEMEKSYTEEEIKQYREHISELVMHSEAQSSLYQEKFKAWEVMVSEVKPDPATSTLACPVADKTEKSAARTRGSGSPFRCISNLVQQMNLEKDLELSAARCQIEELEALAASRQKEVCTLTARLAAAENMTHDVIRDLLGLKMDMTNYANLIDQEQVQNLLQKADQQSEETITKEKEILNLNGLVNHLLEERKSLIEEINQRKSDMLASQVMVERLQQREQLLTAQNEILKMDKANLQTRIAEEDEKVKYLIRQQSTSKHAEQPVKILEKSSVRAGVELSKRLARSDKLLSHMQSSMKNKNTKESLEGSLQHQQP